MRCPDCGAKTERYAHVCGKCGAPLPEIPQPDYGPGVVGASDADTRWAVGGPMTLCIAIVVAIAVAVLMVVTYYHEAGKASPDTTSSKLRPQSSSLTSAQSDAVRPRGPAPAGLQPQTGPSRQTVAHLLYFRPQTPPETAGAAQAAEAAGSVPRPPAEAE
jgi:hypothetical protein